MDKNGIADALSKRIGASQSVPDQIGRSYNDMFGLNKNDASKERIVDIDLAIAKPHPQDPFKPYSEDKPKELQKVLQMSGCLTTRSLKTYL